MVARGIANNNPGNLRKSTVPWRGKIRNGPDPDFETFDTPLNGIRALAKTLLTYQRAHGLKTVADIIERWAPRSENDTDAYVADVAQRMGVLPDQILDLVAEPMLLQALVRAVIHHENGSCPFSATTLADGIQSALA